MPSIVLLSCLEQILTEYRKAAHQRNHSLIVNEIAPLAIDIEYKMSDWDPYYHEDDPPRVRRVRFQEPELESPTDIDYFGEDSRRGSITAEPEEYEGSISLEIHSVVSEHSTTDDPESYVMSGAVQPGDEPGIANLDLEPFPLGIREEDLEYGEEPASQMDYITRANMFEIFNKQYLPETAARHSRNIGDMSTEEIEQCMDEFDHVHSPSRIREGLYIANYETAYYYLSGKGNREKYYPKIGHVLSIIYFSPHHHKYYDALTPSNPEEFPEGTTLLLRVKDSTQVNLMELFPLIVSFITHALNQGASGRDRGRGVLVHCRKGMSRSVAAVMAYLVWAENLTVIEVWRQVKAQRLVAWPNPEFYTQLVMWKMFNCKLTDDQGEIIPEYREYLVEKGLYSALEGVKADLTAHLGLKPPRKRPLNFR